MATQVCKGNCGTGFYTEPCGIMIENPPYKDGYCKDCYIKKLEQDIERLRAQIEYNLGVSVISPPASY